MKVARVHLNVRLRVLAVINSAARPLTGAEIAKAVGIPYKPVIDAINSLHNYDQVTRLGRKSTAQWTRFNNRQQTDGIQDLHNAFDRMRKRNT